MRLHTKILRGRLINLPHLIWGQPLKFNLKGVSPGATLLEILISIAILGTFAVILLSTLSVGSISTNTSNVQSYAEDLAQNEMEYVMSYSYLTPPATYPVISNIPAGYMISASATPVSGYYTLSKVTVTVSRSARVLVTLDSLKASP